MKNKILISLILLIICLFSTTSYAKETGTVYIESSRDVVEKEDTIEITVNLKDTTTAAFDFSLYFDNTKWDYISKIDNTKVENNHIIYVWYDKTGGRSAKSGELIKLKFKAKENGLSTFSLEGNFYNSSGQTIQATFKEKQVQIGKENKVLQNEEEKGNDKNSSNANLEVLRLDIEGITPDFSSDIYEYYLTVKNSVKDIEVLAISQNPNANVEITGNNNLKEGLNTIKIKVISEDKKEEKIYTIKVTKTANLEAANTNLEILAIENTLLNPPFDISETKYTTEISNNVQEINVLAVPENEKAKVQITGTNNLKEGNNTVTITVTAANGFSKKKYQVNVYKRNQEEQIKYEEDEKEQVKKVEEAYEIEKVGSSEKEQLQNNNKASNTVWTILIIVVILIVGGSIFLYSKYKTNRK